MARIGGEGLRQVYFLKVDLSCISLWLTQLVSGLGLVQPRGLISLPRVPASLILSQVSVQLRGCCRTRPSLWHLVWPGTPASPELAWVSAHFQTLRLRLVGSFALPASLHTRQSHRSCGSFPSLQHRLRSRDFGQVLGRDLSSSLHPGVIGLSS